MTGGLEGRAHSGNQYGADRLLDRLRTLGKLRIHVAGVNGFSQRPTGPCARAHQVGRACYMHKYWGPTRELGHAAAGARPPYSLFICARDILHDSGPQPSNKDGPRECGVAVYWL